jgi:hypothetical protein
LRRLCLVTENQKKDARLAAERRLGLLGFGVLVASRRER